MNDSLTVSQLRECQAVGYQVLEDMRRLYHDYPPVADQARQSRQVAAFLGLVNRRRLENADPNLPAAINRAAAHSAFMFCSDRTEMLQLATASLACYDPRATPGSLPPPLWLRLLPTCLSLVESLPQIRWLAFTVEAPAETRGARVTESININSNTLLESNGVDLVRNARPLMDVVFDSGALRGSQRRAVDDALLAPHAMAMSLGSTNKTTSYPYTCWGIRFRSAPAFNAIPAFFPWLDIKLPALTSHRGTLAFLSDSKPLEPYAPKIFSFPTPSWEEFFKDAYSRWASKSHNSQFPTDPVLDYAETLARFYPNGAWPEAGIDCLLCPAVFWSLTPDHAGTAAAIYWGFEGHISDSVADSLLLATQVMLPGIGQFARLADISTSDRDAGTLDAMNTLGHELKKVSGIFADEWVPTARDLFEIEYTEDLDHLLDRPNLPKLGRLRLARKSEPYTQDIGIAPFRSAFFMARSLLHMWSGTNRKRDLPFFVTTPDGRRKRVYPHSLVDLIEACWNVAIETVTLFALAEAISMKRPYGISAAHDARLKLHKWLGSVPPIVLGTNVPFDDSNWSPDAPYYEELFVLTRLLLAVTSNCLQHMDLTRPLTVELQHPDAGSPFTMRFISFERRSIDTTAHEWATHLGANPREVSIALELFHAGVTSGVVIGAAKSKDVYRSCLAGLSGTRLRETPQAGQWHEAFQFPAFWS